MQGVRYHCRTGTRMEGTEVFQAKGTIFTESRIVNRPGKPW
jgi:hypothetical protein